MYKEFASMEVRMYKQFASMAVRMYKEFVDSMAVRMH
jgi:hypothetical protein